MFGEDLLSVILDDVEDVEQEQVVVTSGYGTKTWGIDWRNGRLFKADPVRSKAERAIKYLVTPRGQVEVYPSYASNRFDEGYGSLVWTMLGQSFTDEETAQTELQAMCDETALVVPDIEAMQVEKVTIVDDKLIARIRIITDTGEEVTLDDITITD